jgi:hypothetical protein
MIGLFVALFLFFIKPFGLANIELPAIEWILVMAGYGLVTFLIALFSDRVVKVAFPQFFDEQVWTVGKQIIWVVFVVLLIGIGNLFYSNLLGFVGISGTSFLIFQAYTIIVAFFPVVVMTLLNRVRLLRTNLEAVSKINASLEGPINAEKPYATLIFSSDSGKDELRLDCDQFLYAESADNYSDVVFVVNNIVRRELIRSTLKRLESLNNVYYIVRPHRAYLVNLLKVSRVIGNSQGYRLAFKELEDSVPVARRSASQIREQLAALHSS